MHVAARFVDQPFTRSCTQALNMYQYKLDRQRREKKKHDIIDDLGTVLVPTVTYAVVFRRHLQTNGSKSNATNFTIRINVTCTMYTCQKEGIVCSIRHLTWAALIRTGRKADVVVLQL